jgi:hypothetical protein
MEVLPSRKKNEGSNNMGKSAMSRHEIRNRPGLLARGYHLGLIPD